VSTSSSSPSPPRRVARPAWCAGWRSPWPCLFTTCASTAPPLSAALDEAQAALDALSPQDRARWDKIAAARLAVARVGRWEGTAPPEQQQWLDKVKAAILDEQSTAVSDALRRAWHADEVAFWAVAGAAEQLRRVDVAAAQLAACLEALEAQGLAVVPSVSAPDTAYQVAKDGSNCTCDGFRFRGTCKHTKKIA
jgi:hypothetical protein